MTARDAAAAAYASDVDEMGCCGRSWPIECAEAGFRAGAQWALEHDERVKALVKALQILRNETRGTLSAHELAIRYDSGNSNWTCLEMALESAEKALAQFRAGGKGEG